MYCVFPRVCCFILVSIHGDVSNECLMMVNETQSKFKKENPK